jgi:hypothetical protein
MTLVIDELDSLTGWSSSDTNKIEIVPELNEIDEYIAGDNDKSIVFKLNGDSKGAYVEKSLASIDLTDYDEIVFSVYSTNLQNKGGFFNDLDEFVIQIDFNNTMVDYMVPVYSSMVPITLDISGITTIDRIRITSNTNSETHLVVSHCIAAKDQLPLDIFKAIKTTLETERDRINLNRKFKVGVVTANAGDREITVDISGSSRRDWLDKYAVIEITDGVNSEIHQLWENTEIEYQLARMYDGSSLVNSFTNADVYLYFPIEFGLLETEILLPGIGIHGMVPRPITRGDKPEDKYDSYRADKSVKVRKGLQIYEYLIRIDIEARHLQLLAELQDITKRVISKEKVWMNGRKFKINFAGDPVYVDAVNGYNQIPKIQYQIGIEVKEEIFTRDNLVNTDTINTTVNIK